MNPGYRITAAVFFLLAIALAFLPHAVSAASYNYNNSGDFLNQAVGPTGINQGDVTAVTGNLINRALLIVGLAFFVLMFYGGFQWLTARGGEDQITKAKNIIIAAVIGIAVIVGAYAITAFVTGQAVRSGQAG